MTNIYRITLKLKENKVINYTSLDALYHAHGKEETGVTKGSLYKALRLNNYYENRFISIEKFTAFNKSDVNEKLHLKE